MLLRSLALFLLSATFLACGGESTPKAPLDPVEVPPAPPLNPSEDEEIASGDQLYPWVNNVNVRDRPTTEGKRVARIPEGEPLTWTGEKSGYPYKVTTQDEIIGWVHGGTVKRAGEEKGNPPVSKTLIAFPYFGTYDLSEWEQMPDVARSGGDATTVIQTYKKDGQELTIERTDVGEYGYTHIYTLYDVEKKKILEREFSLSHQDDGQETETILTESVTNNIESPSVTRVRKQNLGQGPIGGEPTRAIGDWRVVDN